MDELAVKNIQIQIRSFANMIAQMEKNLAEYGYQFRSVLWNQKKDNEFKDLQRQVADLQQENRILRAR